jgi:hypothetical protein
VDLGDQAQALLPWAAEQVSRGNSAWWEGLSRYSIDLSVNVDSRVVEGRESVRYTNTESVALDEVVFRLFPQTPGYGGQMAVEEVLVEGRPADTRPNLMDSALYVTLAPPLQVGESVFLELVFRAVVPEDVGDGYGQFSSANGIMALPNVYPLIPVYDDEGWNVELAPPYGDAVYSDVALYHVQVRAASDQTVVASGSAVARMEDSDGTVTTTFVSGPMRDFVVVMSSDFVTSTDTVDGVRVTSYYVGQDAEGGDRALSYAVDAMRVFNEYFGPYPYSELDVVETPTTAGGIEYPGLVVIAQRLYDQGGGFAEFVVAHEVAHQWWYALVGNDQVDEPWLDEALAQYSTLLYYEEVRGSRVAEEVRRRSFEEPYERLVSEGLDAPVGQPVRAFSGEDYGPVVYGKGPLFFQALRDEVGDAEFQSLLRAYLDAFRYGIATPEGFLGVAEKVSDRELDSLYQKWILGSSR